MLTRVYADNYRCLVNFEFRPLQVNLLVGANGSGKSALFEVLEAIQDVVVLGDSVEGALPSSTLTRWETRNIQRFELDVQGNGGVYLYLLEVEHNRKANTVAIRKEQVLFDGAPLFKYEGRKALLYTDLGDAGTPFPADPRRSFLSILEERSDNQRLTWFKRFLGNVWILHLDPSRMTSLSKKEARWIERDGSNLASWYQRLPGEDPGAIDALRSDMSEVIDGLQYFRLVSAGGAAKELFATLAKGDGSRPQTYDVSLEELSPGQRQLFALYAILHVAASQVCVLCFDEPDNFLALREIQPWLQKLSDLAQENGSQVLLVSHHPEVIDYLAADSAFMFQRPTGDVVRVRPFVVNRDSGLKASGALARGWDDESAPG